ncbi:MAG: hypothetical protein F6K47_31905 [Symploca sp. SIO2E6]|nr:hypothetical protein [Symploca sp. SIO2E6]
MFKFNYKSVFALISSLLIISDPACAQLSETARWTSNLHREYQITPNINYLKANNDEVQRFWELGIGNWELGIGNWELGIGN